MGDFRTYDYTLALRGVTTTDFMTADWARIPYDVLDTISRRTVNRVQHINRIVYDITSKPPATIEWEQLNNKTPVIQNVTGVLVFQKQLICIVDIYFKYLT